MAIVFLLSLTIFLMSLSAHLLVMFGQVQVPLNWAFGFFFTSLIAAVWANTHIIWQRHHDYLELPPGEFWHYITENAPYWMRSAQIMLLLYAFFNFYFTMLVINRGGYPRMIEGAYLLVRHKEVIETLTAAEYWWHASFVVRMLSSIVMAVNFAALLRWVARWRTVEESSPVAVSEKVAR